MQKYKVDSSGESVIFSASMAMCVTLFGHEAEEEGGFEDSFGKLTLTLGSYVGVAQLPFHSLRVADDEYQQLVLPVTFLPTIPLPAQGKDLPACNVNLTCLASFVENVFHHVVSVVSDAESTDDDEEEEESEMRRWEDDEEVDLEDSGFFGKSMVRGIVALIYISIF